MMCIGWRISSDRDGSGNANGFGSGFGNGGDSSDVCLPGVCSRVRQQHS